MGRELDWEGAVNVRDLGGIPAGSGRTVKRGAVVRAGSLDGLTAAGWESLLAAGVRTIVDLRNADERTRVPPAPDGVETLWLPLDGQEHEDFWRGWGTGPQFGTPLYYRPHLERFPERSVRVLAAVAAAAPGGAVVHCQTGRDRTGQIAMLALALAGATARDIAADYALGARAAGPVPEVEAFLADRRITAEQVVHDLAGAPDLVELLEAGGLTRSVADRLRVRMSGEDRPGSDPEDLPSL